MGKKKRSQPYKTFEVYSHSYKCYIKGITLEHAVRLFEKTYGQTMVFAKQIDIDFTDQFKHEELLP